MENLPITEQALEKMKNELIIAVRAAMDEQNKKRDQKMEQICKLIEENKTSSDSIRQTVMQLPDRLKKSGESRSSNTEPAAGSGISEGNIVRLMKTFEEEMKNAGKNLRKAKDQPQEAECWTTIFLVC